MTTQVITAVSRSGENGLTKEQPYLFMLNITVEGVIRILTFPEGVELFYHTIHDFLLSWDYVTSQGWGRTEQEAIDIIASLSSGSQN
ncbi:MAG: hypothetical protein EOP49_11160 [Sphingobacteriales bacterium]|nr:MAG: hypothetical protein EOP49_11160 [Sphingobacteriales bacterium]